MTQTITKKRINPRREWFASKKEAIAAYEQRKNSISVDGVYRQKEGRHKGQYFVGNFIAFINRY